MKSLKESLFDRDLVKKNITKTLWEIFGKYPLKIEELKITRVIESKALTNLCKGMKLPKICGGRSVADKLAALVFDRIEVIPSRVFAKDMSEISGGYKEENVWYMNTNASSNQMYLDKKHCNEIRDLLYDNDVFVHWNDGYKREDYEVNVIIISHDNEFQHNRSYSVFISVVRYPVYESSSVWVEIGGDDDFKI